jgi:hypothetical protein
MKDACPPDQTQTGKMTGGRRVLMRDGKILFIISNFEIFHFSHTITGTECW